MVTFIPLKEEITTFNRKIKKSNWLQDYGRNRSSFLFTNPVLTTKKTHYKKTNNCDVVTMKNLLIK